jgi:hypothetical protein
MAPRRCSTIDTAATSTGGAAGVALAEDEAGGVAAFATRTYDPCAGAAEDDDAAAVAAP